jgi:hypothetical protein
LSLQLAAGLSGQFVLTAAGAATRLVEIETSSDLMSWQPLTLMVNASGTNRLYDTFSASARFFRAKHGF